MPHVTPTPSDLHASVIDRFHKVATTPSGDKTFPVGPEIARQLGYDAVEIAALPVSVTESFCGVGNPLSLGQPQSGQTVLDLGCGAGLDSLLAARQVGPQGEVIGIDMTPEMVAKARRNALLIGLSNAEFLIGGAERLPLSDASVDLVISNGVFNLCPDKPGVLAEVFRVLGSGGRLEMADILLHEDVTPEDLATRGSWSD